MAVFLHENGKVLNRLHVSPTEQRLFRVRDSNMAARPFRAFLKASAVVCEITRAFNVAGLS